MTIGSVIGTDIGTVGGFGPKIMYSIGDPDDIVLAPSGTVLYDAVNGTMYRNDSANIGAGSEWTSNLI